MGSACQDRPHDYADGPTGYPSKEEAEYAAALFFHIAVAVSWGTGRLGIAKLRVPRAPPDDCVGEDQVAAVRQEGHARVGDNPYGIGDWFGCLFQFAAGVEVLLLVRAVM